MSLYGIDTSGNNPAATVQAQLKRKDLTFIIAKATEGLKFNDPRFVATHAEAKAAGSAFFAYMFAWQNQDPVGEVKHFLDIAQPAVGEAVVIDLENWDSGNNYAAMQGCGWSTRWAYARKAVQTAISETNTRPWLYMNWDYVRNYRATAAALGAVASWEEFIKNPLWIAEYVPAGTCSYANPIAGGTVAWYAKIHQFSAGSTLSGGLDEDYFFGSAIDLARLTIQEDSMSQAQVDSIIAAVNGVKADVAAVKADVAAVKTQATQNGYDVSAVADFLGKKVDNVATSAAGTAADVALIKTQTTSLATDVPSRLLDIHDDLDAIGKDAELDHADLVNKIANISPASYQLTLGLAKAT